MAGDISLAAFKSALGRGTSWRDASRCVVLTRKDDGIQAMAAKPVSPVSTWSRLFGTTRLYKAMFGSESYREPRRQNQLTTLHAFKAALVNEYGPVIAGGALKTIRSRDVLILSQARSTLARAELARKDTVRVNEARLGQVLAEAHTQIVHPGSFIPVTTSWSDASLERTLRAYFGANLSTADVSKATMQQAARLLADLAQTGMTEQAVDTLLAPPVQLEGDTARHRLIAAHREHVSLALAAEVAKRIRDGDHVVGEPVRLQPGQCVLGTSPPHRGVADGKSRSAGPGDTEMTALETALARAALDPAAGLAMEEEEIDAAAVRAKALRAVIDTTAGMSEPRALHMLDFVAGVPMARRQQVLEHLCQGTLSAITDVRGVVPGSTAGEHLAPDYRLARVQDAVFEEFRRDIAAARPETFDAEDGSTFALSQTCLKDATRRTPYAINGHALPQVDPDDKARFARQFRSHFPAGRAGDQMARLASDCLNQNMLNTLMKSAAGITASRKDQSVLHEAEALPDGSWRLRTTGHFRIQAKANEQWQPVLLAQPLSALYVIEHVISPGATSDAPPRLASSRMETAFA